MIRSIWYLKEARGSKAPSTRRIASVLCGTEKRMERRGRGRGRWVEQYILAREASGVYNHARTPEKGYRCVHRSTVNVRISLGLRTRDVISMNVHVSMRAVSEKATHGVECHASARGRVGTPHHTPPSHRARSGRSINVPCSPTKHSFSSSNLMAATTLMPLKL